MKDEKIPVTLYRAKEGRVHNNKDIGEYLKKPKKNISEITVVDIEIQKSKITRIIYSRKSKQIGMYYPLPFPFENLIAKPKRQNTLSLEESISDNIKFLIFSRLGEYAYDRSMGFEIWDRDREVFYREKRPYFEKEDDAKGLNTGKANMYYETALADLIKKNEPRVIEINTKYQFSLIRGDKEKFRRKIEIEVACKN